MRKSLQQVLGLTQVVLPVGHGRKTSDWEATGRHPESPWLAVFTNHLVYNMSKNVGSSSGSLNYVFCPTGSPKPKVSSFTVINYKEKQQILTLKKLEPVNV